MEGERGQRTAVAERDKRRDEGGVDTGRKRENENEYFVSSRMSF